MRTERDVYQPGKLVTREELYEAVWSKTVKTLVREWNTNNMQVHQACEKLQVPRPDIKFWVWVRYGRPVKKKPLRRPTKRLPKHWVLLTRLDAPEGVETDPRAAAARDAARKEAAKAETARHRREAELRRQEARREREERERQRLEEDRGRLVQGSETWLKARRVRWFIRACERAMRKDGSWSGGGWKEAWLAWAKGHADQLDPMTNGFMEAERERFAGGAEGAGNLWAGREAELKMQIDLFGKSKSG